MADSESSPVESDTSVSETYSPEPAVPKRRRTSWWLRAAVAIDVAIFGFLLFVSMSIPEWWDVENSDEFYRLGNRLASMAVLITVNIFVVVTLIVLAIWLQRSGRRRTGTLVAFLGIPLIILVAEALPYALFASEGPGFTDGKSIVNYDRSVSAPYKSASEAEAAGIVRQVETMLNEQGLSGSFVQVPEGTQSTCRHVQGVLRCNINYVYDMKISEGTDVFSVMRGIQVANGTLGGNGKYAIENNEPLEQGKPLVLFWKDKSKTMTELLQRYDPASSVGLIDLNLSDYPEEGPVLRLHFDTAFSG